MVLNNVTKFHKVVIKINGHIYGVLGQVWYLIASILDRCLLHYFYRPPTIKTGEFSLTKGNNY